MQPRPAHERDRWSSDGYGGTLSYRTCIPRINGYLSELVYCFTPSKMPLSCVCIVSIVLLSLLYVTKIKIVNNNENGNGYITICLLSGWDSRQIRRS